MRILALHYNITDRLQYRADFARYRIAMRHYLRRQGHRVAGLKDLNTDELEHLIINHELQTSNEMAAETP